MIPTPTKNLHNEKMAMVRKVSRLLYRSDRAEKGAPTRACAEETRVFCALALVLSNVFISFFLLLCILCLKRDKKHKRGKEREILQVKVILDHGGQNKGQRQEHKGKCRPLQKVV